MRERSTRGILGAGISYYDARIRRSASLVLRFPDLMLCDDLTHAIHTVPWVAAAVPSIETVLACWLPWSTVYSLAAAQPACVSPPFSLAAHCPVVQDKLPVLEHGTATRW